MQMVFNHWLHDRSTYDSADSVTIVMFTETATTSTGTTKYLYFNRSLYNVLQDLRLFIPVILRADFKIL